MARRTCALVLGAALGCGRVGFEASPDAAPTRRNRIDVRGSLLTDDVTGFPLPITLRAPAFDVSQVRPDGADLRVYAADQTTALPYELEHIDATSAVLWVRVPMITGGADLVLWVTYGDPSAAPGQRPTEVWTSEYIAVWHLGDGRDSTANGLDGAFTGTAPVPGVVGLGRDLQGGWMEVADAPALAAIGATGAATWSAWARATAVPAGYSSLIDRRTETTSADDFRFGPNGAGGFNGQLSLDPGPVNLGLGGGDGTAAAGTWHLYAVTWDGAAARAHIDSSVIQNRPAAGTVHASANPVWLGAGCNSCLGGIPNDDKMDGVIDEARIEAVARSSGWMAAQQLALTGALVTVQPFE